MTWGKGFYRVWLLLSAIWIGISVYAANPVTYSWLWKAPQYEIAFVTGNKIVLDTSKSHDELVATLTVAMKKEAVDLKERDEILAGINSRYETAGEQAERVWLATFVPPVALLGFGLAIAWVLRGFRSRTWLRWTSAGTTMRHHHARLLRATLTASLMLLPMAETSYAKVGQFTGHDYLRHCTSNWTPQNKDEQEMAIYCVGFIEASITLIVAMDGRTYCLPVGATPQDVLKTTVAFLQANPEQKQNLFAIVMMMAVQDHWPCH